MYNPASYQAGIRIEEESNMAEVMIEDIKKVSFKEGDVVVLTTPHNLTNEQADYIRSQLMSDMPQGVKGILLEGGITMSVLTREEN